jgi:5'-nucleotidase
VPMGVARYGEDFVRRQDPRGRDYYWATNEPRPERGAEETDLSALEDGFVTLTPLEFDLTKPQTLEEMKAWNLKLPPNANEGYQPEA